jgi:Mg-chelatase subunit ChlD
MRNLRCMRLHTATLATAVALACLVSPSLLQAQIKENLDLPFDALGADEEEEDAPEVINFYTVTLEGEGFFYVIDHSGSMMDSGELHRAKQEVLKNLNEFSERVQFGVVFFAGAATKFPTNGRPADADNANKQSARSFIQSVQRANGSCPLQGLQAGLLMANQARSPRKVVVYVGDGGGTCEGVDEAQYLEKTLSQVTSSNFQRVKINTIGVLDISKIGEQFLRKLASANGGTYTRI